MDQTALLEMVGIEKSYGRVRAVLASTWRWDTTRSSGWWETTGPASPP